MSTSYGDSQLFVQELWKLFAQCIAAFLADLPSTSSDLSFSAACVIIKRCRKTWKLLSEIGFCACSMKTCGNYFRKLVSVHKNKIEKKDKLPPSTCVCPIVCANEPSSACPWSPSSAGRAASRMSSTPGVPVTYVVSQCLALHENARNPNSCIAGFASLHFPACFSCKILQQSCKILQNPAFSCTKSLFLQKKCVFPAFSCIAGFASCKLSCSNSCKKTCMFLHFKNPISAALFWDFSDYLARHRKTTKRDY